ncbi:metallophosphoesterase [Desulfurococcaceae archaeon MEX13E-LK6-19]|nr:metallophosphoesterase [Desulfurococcaceae archaeon MEX13E-LK6-19]
MGITLLATSDIHSPRYLDIYLKLLKTVDWSKIDVIVWAGDLVEKNNISALKPAYEKTLSLSQGKPIVAVFGNEEYHEYEEEYMRRYEQVIWLKDNYVILEIKGSKIGFIGTRGALEKPTLWQSKNMPWLSKYYEELPAKIKELATKIRSEVDYLVLVSHYGVTYRNLRGEKPYVWPYLASKRMEKIITPDLFDAVIHGHAHNARVEKVLVNNVPVYNVSLPAFNKLFEIVIGGKKGLLQWLG